MCNADPTCPGFDSLRCEATTNCADKQQGRLCTGILLNSNTNWKVCFKSFPPPSPPAPPSPPPSPPSPPVPPLLPLPPVSPPPPPPPIECSNDYVWVTTEEETCIDTPNWYNGPNWYTCARYIKEKLCCGEGACPGKGWSLGAGFNYPENNCCACAPTLTYKGMYQQDWDGYTTYAKPWVIVHADLPCGAPSQYNGGLSENGVANTAACQAICATSSACDFFSYSFSNNQKCSTYQGTCAFGDADYIGSGFTTYAKPTGTDLTDLLRLQQQLLDQGPAIMTFTQATAACANLGGRLPMPKTEADNNALLAFFGRNNVADGMKRLTNKENTDLHVFLGAQSGSQYRGWTLPGADPLQERSAFDGVWIWEDGTSFEDVTEKEDAGRGTRTAGEEQYRFWRNFPESCSKFSCTEILKRVFGPKSSFSEANREECAKYGGGWSPSDEEACRRFGNSCHDLPEHLQDTCLRGVHPQANYSNWARNHPNRAPNYAQVEHECPN